MTQVLQKIWELRQWNALSWGGLYEFNSLGASDAIWHYRTSSAWVQMMACCLLVPGNYLSQCWLIVLWHLSKRNVQDIYPLFESKNYSFNALRPRQNECHFTDDIFKYIFLNENAWILMKILLKFVPRCPINNIPASVQIMVWGRTCDKPLSEPLVIILLTHICVTRPQWVNIPAAFPMGHWVNE